MTRLARIVSGGQTGVDRGALDAALAAKFPCGGWCPAGRRAEDGRIPERYPLQEMDTEDYRARTRLNVLDSDGTLILYFGTLEGGTELTAEICRAVGRPCELIDASATPVTQAAQRALGFVEAESIGVLNVAGPRQSKEPRAAEYARRVVEGLLANATRA